MLIPLRYFDPLNAAVLIDINRNPRLDGEEADRLN